MKHTRIAPTALAVIVAASITATPLVAAAQDSQAASAHVTASTAASAATSTQNVTLPNTWTATEEENQAILAQAQAAELAGYAALEQYFNGKEVPTSDFLTIDADALALINEDAAKLVREVQATLKQANEPTPVAPSTPDAGTTAPSSSQGSADNNAANSNASASENAPANEVDEAPDDMVQESELLADDIVYVARNLTTQQFIDTIGEDARELCQQNDLYASVMIAQAVVESASGSSGLSCEPYNNLFGIKGSYEGRSVRMKTQEDDGEGHLETVVAEFRKYPSMLESLEDYVGLLTGNSLYAPVKKSNTESYTDACDYLQGRYATSTSYARTLKAYIDAYDLTQYDKPAEQAKADATLDAVLTPAATHQVFSSDASLFATAVPEPGIPARQANPVFGGILAALAAVGVGAFGYWLYWRRKVEGERAMAGAHVASGSTEAAAETRPLDATWLSEVVENSWEPAHAAPAKQPAHAATSNCEPAGQPAHATSTTALHAAKPDDPTNPMDPVLPPLE